MTITHDTQHVSEGLALMLDMFRNTKVTAGILSAYLQSVQDCEDAFWTLLVGFNLDSGVGIVLDLIGQIVGEPRNGRGDGWYRIALRLRIATNRSDGCPETLILLLQLAEPGSVFRFVEIYPAAIDVTWYGSADAFRALVEFLPQAKPGGVEITIRYAPDVPTRLVTPAWVPDVVGVGESWSTGLPFATCLWSVTL